MRWIIFILLIANAGYFFWGNNYLQVKEGVRSAAAKASAEGMADRQDLPSTPGKRASVTLLSELEQKASPLTPRQALGSELSGANIEPVTGFCWYIGFSARNKPGAPVVDSAVSGEKAILAVKERLASIGIASTVQDIRVSMPEKYLIYIPPYPSKELALGGLKDLLVRGYDAFLFESGALKNGISLGFYSVGESAERELVRYQGDGLQARLKISKDYRRESWLRLTVAENNKIVSRFWNKLVADWPALVRQKNYCQSIAPKLDFE